jgi:hypothetical protein
MTDKIKIKGREFNYYPVHLVNDGSEPRLDIDVAIENLKIMRTVLNNADIPFMLIYGTLLGAVRDGGFIKHDSDTDLLIDEEVESKLLDVIPVLEKEGLLLVRYEKITFLGLGDIVYSFMKNNMWIDIFILQHAGEHCIIAGIKYPYYYFIKAGKVVFYDDEYAIPSNIDDCLTLLYGKDWKTPIENAHAGAVKLIFRMRVYFFIIHWGAVVLKFVLPKTAFQKLKNKIFGYK